LPCGKGLAVVVAWNEAAIWPPSGARLPDPSQAIPRNASTARSLKIGCPDRRSAGISCNTSATCQEAKVKLNSKGQVTIPAELRHRHGFDEGDEVDVVEDGSTLRIVHSTSGQSRGERLVNRMRGRATTTQTTDELMKLLRGE
jgi:AbrB family looped-hinge helix DNA binding protein